MSEIIQAILARLADYEELGSIPQQWQKIAEAVESNMLAAAPVAAQEPTPTDRYVDSLHRAVERLTAALHVATLRAHPHMTHAEIQAEIVRIARTPAPAADGAQGERQPDGMAVHWPPAVDLHRGFTKGSAQDERQPEDRRIVEIHGIRLGLYRIVLANGEELEREGEPQPRLGDFA